ncbi:MAG: dihydropteroate synthase [Gammaproteobacteria bacterium]|nr:dihydropteroate synthase [Gammaproteobacteria bacterium]MBU1647195.1 dihydropteroate synthase [Gammaproteobacteria bacterium]MBU1972707.1 dihydropteroate synthase [Gammaproteobacteria bacterium]
MKTLHCGRFRLALDRPLIMGIVNLTPDSFSGDGVGGDVERAIAHAHAQVAAGADILDLGAESSRPGAPPVSADDELLRLLPLLKALRDVSVPLSVDTMKPEVMRAALAEGAAMINDIAALALPGAVAAVAETDAAVCLMHMQGEPRTMQQNPQYADVVAEVGAYLEGRARECEMAGIGHDRIVLDPGFGFGKTAEHNLALLRALPELALRGFPVLAGLSRKSLLGAITGRPVGERLPASLAAALIAVQKGAAIVRVHDVAATRDALAVLNAVEIN